VNVPLDREFGDAELGCDVPVRETVGDELQHLALALGQRRQSIARRRPRLGGMQSFDQEACEFARQRGFTVRGGAKRTNEARRRGVLGEKADRAGSQYGSDHRVLRVAGPDDDLQTLHIANGLEGCNRARRWKVEIDNRKIGNIGRHRRDE